MKLSIVISIYNEEEAIADCINSLEKQNVKESEIIVVDDGSTDNSISIVSNLQLKYKNLTLLKQNHQGPALARNLGAKHAKGKILIFVDGDMTFDKNFIKMLVRPIIQGKTIGTWSSDEFVSNWENVWARCWNINQNLPKRRRHPRKVASTQKVFRAMLKTEFDKVGGFEKGGYTDDYTLSDKLYVKATVAPKAVFYHRNPDSLSEVFYQAKWVGKRKYKLGFLGSVLAMVRTSLPLSLIVGTYKSIRHKSPRFLIFKLVYDLGVVLGIIQFVFFNKGAK